MNLCKGSVILEGENILLENFIPPSPTRINWYVPSGKNLIYTSGIAVDLVNIDNDPLTQCASDMDSVTEYMLLRVIFLSLKNSWMFTFIRTFALNRNIFPGVFYIGFYVFWLMSPESRDLLDFYCRASITYNIILLTLIFTREVLAVLFPKKTQLESGFSLKLNNKIIP